MSDFVTAWRTNEPWLRQFVEGAVRDLSKTGGLGANAHVMRELAAGLQRDELIWLYARLQESYRPTDEWRGEFLSLFPQLAQADLPPPLFDEEEAARWAEAARAESSRKLAKDRAEYAKFHCKMTGSNGSTAF